MDAAAMNLTDWLRMTDEEWAEIMKDEPEPDSQLSIDWDLLKQREENDG